MMGPAPLCSHLSAVGMVVPRSNPKHNEKVMPISLLSVAGPFLFQAFLHGRVSALLLSLSAAALGSLHSIAWTEEQKPRWTQESWPRANSFSPLITEDQMKDCR